jgi:hypothetical protein
MLGCGLVSLDSAEDNVVGSCEHTIEILCYLDQLNGWSPQEGLSSTGPVH